MPAMYLAELVRRPFETTRSIIMAAQPLTTFSFVCVTRRGGQKQRADSVYLTPPRKNNPCHPRRRKRSRTFDQDERKENSYCMVIDGYKKHEREYTKLIAWKENGYTHINTRDKHGLIFVTLFLSSALSRRKVDLIGLTRLHYGAPPLHQPSQSALSRHA